MLKFLTLLPLILCFGLHALATVYPVQTVIQFNTAQINASPGDTILWRTGTFADIDLVVTKNDLKILSEAPGKTIFNGASKLKVTGDRIRFSGFQYVGGNIGAGWVIEVSGSHNVFSDLNVQNYFCNKYLVIQAQGRYNEVIYCNFEHKLPEDRDQNVLSVLVDPQTPGYNQIRY